jgi:hypothetical protein
MLRCGADLILVAHDYYELPHIAVEYHEYYVYGIVWSPVPPIMLTSVLLITYYAVVQTFS